MVNGWNYGDSEKPFKECLTENDLSEWEKPIPLGEQPPEEINPLWFPPVIRNLAESIKESLQVSPDMPYMAMLACLSLCNARKYRVECRKDWQEPLNLFIVLVNDPGTRKSALLKIVTAPIIDHEQAVNAMEKSKIAQNRSEMHILEEEIKVLEQSVIRGKGDRSQLNAKIQERSDFKEIRETQYIADNATVESITSLLCEQNGRLGVFSAEGGLFDIMAGLYSKMESFDTILSAHSGEDIRVNRKGRPPEHIKAAALTILLGIQPSVLEDALSKKKFNSKGLIARFLFVMCKRDINDYDFYTPAISSDAQWEYIKLITTLLDNPLAEEPTMIYFSKEAEEEFAEFYKEIKTRRKTDLERILFFSEKLNGATARIAANLHIAEHPENPQDYKISGGSMRNAIAIARYLISHCKKAIDDANADPLMEECKYIVQKLRRGGKKDIISKRDILANCRKFQKNSDLEPVIDQLQNLGYLEMLEEESKAGRPSLKYAINPWLFEEEGKGTNEQ